MTLEVWVYVLSLVGVLLLGGVIGFFITRYIFQKQLKENPPINEKMIRVMFQQMGRTASEAQIRAIMKNIKNAK